MTPDQFASAAERAYRGYAAFTGGLTYDGRPMPRWDQLTAHIREAWRAAIVAALEPEGVR